MSDDSVDEEETFDSMLANMMAKDMPTKMYLMKQIDKHVRYILKHYKNHVGEGVNKSFIYNKLEAAGLYQIQPNQQPIALESMRSALESDPTLLSSQEKIIALINNTVEPHNFSYQKQLAEEFNRKAEEINRRNEELQRQINALKAQLAASQPQQNPQEKHPQDLDACTTEIESPIKMNTAAFFTSSPDGQPKGLKRSLPLATSEEDLPPAKKIKLAELPNEDDKLFGEHQVSPEYQGPN
jgi:hypothetical protein